MEEMKTKVCRKCGKTLPISDFHKNKKSSDGLHSYCKECHKEYNLEYNRSNWRKKKDEAHKLLPVFTNPELSRFQPRELLAELKARGYEWEKMYAPRQEVLYSKV